MLTLKSQLICSYCCRIFKDPIELPCEHTICREHLSDRDVRKENKIKCNECKKVFQIKDNDFKSIQAFTKLIESQSYLNEEEKSLKQDLEDSIRKFFEFYDEYEQNKTKLELDAFEHFQEMRFKIDEHRERLKVKIDDIALKMIDETKKHEEAYLKTLKENFSSFDDCKSLQIELYKIEETFRNPSLLIQTIENMQQKQEESLKDIQSKLNEMTKVKDILKATNKFQLSLTSLYRGETFLFGSLKLGLFLKITNLFQSQIIKGEQQCSELIKLCKFSPNDKWSLLYRGTRDGFGTKAFHSECDSHANTLTLLKAKGSEFIFGGFTKVDWESSTKSKWKSDANAFIFSLTNKDNQPVKMKIDPTRSQFAIYCNSLSGPAFGSGCDIRISDNSNATMDSYSQLSCTYKHPQYAYETIEAETFLAGTREFQLDEIEVYQKE